MIDAESAATPISPSAPPAPASASSSPGVAGFTAATFTAAIFTSAALIFVAEPMFTKMVLPLYGGSAEVWNTSVLFFQTVLLGGYLYAHFAPRVMGAARHALVHLVLLALSLATLPIAVRTAWVPADVKHPVLSLLALLTVSLGAPLFLISSTAPLLQAWFARTDHPRRHDPYFLYAASNLGSLGALLSYPLLIERHLTLTGQSTDWARVYGLLVLLIAASVFLTLDSRRRQIPSGPPAPMVARVGVVSNRVRLRWLLLALVPSSLLLGVTTYLSTDIAAVPLLWVLPLSVYLLTFVLVFARRPPVPARWMLESQTVILGILLFLMIWGPRTSSTRLIGFHLLAFGVTAMVCHGELARTRPSAEHLTEYYLWLALGGALGGAFNVIVAPMVFHTVLEYRIMLVLACALRPTPDARSPSVGRVTWWLFGALAACLFVLKGVETRVLPVSMSLDRLIFAMLYFSGMGALVWYRLRSRPLALALGTAIVLGGGSLIDSLRSDVLLLERNFYGLRSVVASSGRHDLIHGITRHGVQITESAFRRHPMSYYSELGPLGDMFRELPLPRGPRRIGVVGLGAGAAAAYARPGDHWTFFEIDPAIERLARDPRYFTFLRDAAAPIRVTIGDGRLALAAVPDQWFDLLVLDAFDSDAIPVHLLTREALSLYRRKVAPGGAIAYHISNRHLRLEPVVARLATEQGLTARVRYAEGIEHRGPIALDYGSTWAVLSAHPQGLGGIARDPTWRSLALDDDVGLWSDDYSNVLGVFIWH